MKLASGTVTMTFAELVDTVRGPDLANRVALRPSEAAQVLGVSPRTLRRLVVSGALPTISDGSGAVLIGVEPLRRWVEERSKVRGVAAQPTGSSDAARIAAELLADED